MSVKYAPVKWNRNKRLYDIVLAASIGSYITMFFVVGKLTWRGDAGISDDASC